MKTPLEQYFDVERIIEFDFVRTTEHAALNAIQWLGRGDKNAADFAACDAIRGMFDLMNVCGTVVIGEGIKDEAPGIFKGEQLGTWLPGTLRFDLAVDPIDGTTNIAKGASNSISCLIAASPEEGVSQALKDIPSFYMMKLAYGPRVMLHLERRGATSVHIKSPVDETIISVARALHKRVQDVVVLVLDRPRHLGLIQEIRKTGAALRMFSDGDIAAAIAPSIPESGADLYMGVGGSPEAVLSAAALKCLGGDIQTMIWPRDEAEERAIREAGYGDELGKVFYADDLAQGQNIIFCATGISDSPLLKGVQIRDHTATTHSLLMRAKSKTVRQITTLHDLRSKTIRLRSDSREHRL